MYGLKLIDKCESENELELDLKEDEDVNRIVLISISRRMRENYK